jgi:hypothetical protein
MTASRAFSTEVPGVARLFEPGYEEAAGNPGRRHHGLRHRRIDAQHRRKRCATLSGRRRIIAGIIVGSGER